MHFSKGKCCPPRCSGFTVGSVGPNDMHSTQNAEPTGIATLHNLEDAIYTAVHVRGISMWVLQGTWWPWTQQYSASS